MKPAVIFFLSLFILLFKGNEGVSAEALGFSQAHEYFKTERSDQQHTSLHKNANVHIQKNFSSRGINYIEEGRDENENTLKKTLVSLKQTLCFYLLLYVGNFYIVKKLALPYCEHLSYTSSFKYLLLRVFRI